MLDTIKLTIPSKMCTFTDKSKFLPENTNALRGYKTFVQNPTKSELLGGNYKPRLTITNRFNSSGYSDWTLSIELSLPKLMFGNNFDELSDTDFPAIIDKLQSKLKEMGVSVFTALIENAPVSAIHYSKNIPLIDGTTPHYYISKIKQANVPLSLDVNETSYQNDGYGFKWHANSYEVAFYDKVHDLGKAKTKGDKRAIERDNSIQFDLFDKLQNRNKFEILRMEVRLNHRQKMKKLFNNIGINTDLTFSKLYSPEISKAVLLNYIDEIRKQRPLIIDTTSIDKDFISGLIVENPQMKLSKLFMLYGMKQAFNKIDTRELRVVLAKYSGRSWSKLITEANSINIAKLPDPLAFINSEIESYRPFKLVDFQDKMINNDKYN
jgi:hypothetical protein